MTNKSSHAAVGNLDSPIVVAEMDRLDDAQFKTMFDLLSDVSARTTDHRAAPVNGLIPLGRIGSYGVFGARFNPGNMAVIFGVDDNDPNTGASVPVDEPVEVTIFAICTPGAVVDGSDGPVAWDGQSTDALWSRAIRGRVTAEIR
jgi:hypothetical protein